MTVQTPTSSTAYGFGRHVDLPFDQAMEKTRAALKEQGFGVLTEIDVQKTMKEKLNADFRRYVILGACNPPLAYRALTAELEIGLLLPCNVVLYEDGEGTMVQAMDPRVALGLVVNPAIAPVAAEARERLGRALDTLGGQEYRAG